MRISWAQIEARKTDSCLSVCSPIQKLARGAQRIRGSEERYPVPVGGASGRGGAAHANAGGNARVSESAAQYGERSDSWIHRACSAGRRVNGRGSGGDARKASLHGVARCDLYPSHHGGRPRLSISHRSREVNFQRTNLGAPRSAFHPRRLGTSLTHQFTATIRRPSRR